MASSGATLAIGIFMGIVVGYLAHAPLQAIFQGAQGAGFGKVGYVQR